MGCNYYTNFNFNCNDDDIMKDKIRKIIKDNYDKNKSCVPWDGMHDEAVKKIIKLFAKKP